MKFDELDSKMRLFETAHDYIVLPGIYMVARIDGRNFTRLTKDVHQFEAPFDARFRDYMVETTSHLMTCGFESTYGYTESDEISILFDPAINTFGRKARKFNSILAGEASARFSLLLGAHAVFDCRISELVTIDLVCDYFRWRNEDAHRNALNAHCYWGLRKQGNSAGAASRQLEHLSVSEKNELLFGFGVNFNDLPGWQRRGVGLYWEEYEKPAVDPRSGQEVLSKRRRIKVDYDLPMRDSYSSFVAGLIRNSGQGPAAGGQSETR